jgi:hypothetical protein
MIVGGLPVAFGEDLKVWHGNLDPILLRTFSLLLNAPGISLLRFIPDDLPEIQPSEQEAPYRRRTPRGF